MHDGHEHKPAHGPHPHFGPGYEPRDVRISVLVVSIALLAILSVAAFAAMLGFRNWVNATRTAVNPKPSPVLDPRVDERPPQGRLQANPPADYKVLKSSAEAVLNSYGWVDESQGIVRIPIERAMDLVAERGLAPKHMPVEPALGAEANNDVF